jgi:hypothetical protein
MKTISRQDSILVLFSCHSQSPLNVTEITRPSPLNCGERLIQISNNVISIFNAD